jgi:uncharacterized protein YbbC (DUF1343 family)
LALFPAGLLLGMLFLQGAEKTPKVMNGIDVLRAQNFAPLAGKRIGLITNHTGLSADGTSTIDLLYRSKVCKLVALFSPEHGIRGKMDDKFGPSVDEATGLHVYSLYGDIRRPTQDMLRKMDALVFDIQDIGARFYTYITTMGYCMEEAAKANILFYVLDRPNPVDGVHIEGPMLDPDKTSFIGYLPLPVRHGMTVGELARYFNEEKKIGVQLHVVEMKSWLRSYYFWDTGQHWVAPSPNMRTMDAALFYPGVCLLEATNVSVGRGTDRPFEIVGAPWIEPRRFAASLTAARISGVRFVPHFFTPNEDKSRGTKCGGVRLLITNANKLNSVTLGFALILVLNKLYPKEFEIDKVIGRLGNAETMKLLKAGQLSAKDITLSRSPDFQNFLDKRRKVLIYDLEAKLSEGR